MPEVLTQVDEPSVDYIGIQTEITVRCPDCCNTDCEHALQIAECVRVRREHAQQLRDQVVETAKAMRIAGKVVSEAFDRAVDALVAFESSQPKEPK